MLELEPSEIKFDLSENEPTVILKVQNPTKEQIAFKVKTTNPKRYLVRPNQDVVDPSQSMEVRISLQSREAKLIKDAASQPDAKISELFKDKFMIQTIELRAEFKTQVEKARADPMVKPMSDVLANMWKDATKDELSNIKLKCNFALPPSSTKNSDKGQKPLSGDSNVGNISTTAANGELDDLSTLRRKYNELLNFTVQLTAERDRLKTSCKEASKELNLLRERNGPDSSDKEDVSVATAVSAFSLWQVMLIAVIAFLLGRMLGN